MAAPFVFVPNEFYELRNPNEVVNHPYPLLAPFKTVMVAGTSFNGGRVVFVWPSYRSLAYFASDQLHVLPALNKDCTLSLFEASRIVRGPIDSVDLCFDQGWTIDPWVHDVGQTMVILGAIDIPETHSNHILMSRMRTDHFYALSWTDLPREIAARLKGFPRVAWVTRLFEGQAAGQAVTLHVEVRVPSKASMKKFEKSVSYALPDFDQIFSISSAAAELFLQRIMPMDLCFQLRRQRNFWINVDQEQIHNSQPSTSRAAKLFGCVTMKKSG